jgi:hypothetical protein
MPLALKASWEVTAGVLPGVADTKLTKRYEYTSADYEADTAPHSGELSFHSKFARVRAEALDYYIQVSMPNLNNWANVRFTWY